MGSAVSCNKCTTAETGSVVNLSDALVLRVAEGIEEPPSKNKEVAPLEDIDWIAKIKCLDDAHSTAYGLTPKDLEAYIQRMEVEAGKQTMKTLCSADTILNCYKFNPDCVLKCAKVVNDFIDCLDAQRLQKLKLIVAQEQDRLNKERRAKRRK